MTTTDFLGVAGQNKLKIASLAIIAAALPVTVYMAMMPQNIENQAVGEDVVRVEVSPGAILAEVNGDSIPISALSYDSFNSPTSSVVVYEWSMSSTNSVGTLSNVTGNITEFKPLGFGCGQITVTVRGGEQVITKGINVAVSDGSNVPDCESNLPTSITTSTPSATPFVSPDSTPVPQVKSINLQVDADSFVRQSKSSRNYGTKTFLATHNKFGLISYLKFNLSQMQGRDIEKATLRLTVLERNENKKANSKNTQNLRLVQNNWTERSITYKNRPPLGILVGSFKGENYGQEIEIDVTAAVEQNKGGFISFSIDSSGDDFLALYSRESGDTKPQLQIEYY